MPTITDSEQIEFLLSCVRHANSGKVREHTRRYCLRSRHTPSKTSPLRALRTDYTQFCITHRLISEKLRKNAASSLEELRRSLLLLRFPFFSRLRQL
ncbi:hypothetical protein BDV40DRAFT_257844 [Aspergillus tamarii]|uniref:Uncharacterized protein n=1 Tax=Aspergillus tamarii TaxID=41984 RepID=A0A5N6V3M4_ASPTM|nr:hypothetical protein BDV40DRAFT_257844 [Aspergillus tamarii]